MKKSFSKYINILIDKNIDNRKIKELSIIEEYLLNRHYSVYWKKYNYPFYIKHPYFHWFIIDKLRKKYKKEYDILFKEFSIVA